MNKRGKNIPRKEDTLLKIMNKLKLSHEDIKSR